MGHHHSSVESSKKRLPPQQDKGPDRKATLKSSRNKGHKVVGVFQDKECTYKRMRCPNSPESDLLPQMLNLSVSFAPSSPLSDGSSHFVPNSPFSDSHPLADVSFSPSPPRPTRKLPAAPSKELNRRRTFLQLPAPEDSIVPTKKKREFNDAFLEDPTNVIYDSTPSGTRPGKENSEWKTPVPIATSTPMDWATGAPKMHFTCAPSVPRGLQRALIEKKAGVDVRNKTSFQPLLALSRTASLQMPSVERGFQSRGPHQLRVLQHPMKMMQTVRVTKQPLQMQTMQRPQQMIHQPPPIPPHRQVPKKASTAVVTAQQPLLARSSSSSNTRSIFMPLAGPSPLCSPMPKPALSNRPSHPQMGLTPRKVKQRRALHGLVVTEKMYGSVDVPKKPMPPVPILSHPRDVNGIYANTAGLMSPMLRNSAMPPKLSPPMYNPPPADYTFTPTPNRGKFPRSGKGFPLPSYSQMYSREGTQTPLSPSSPYQNFKRFGQFV